jgi:hypothetical protein
VPIEDTSRPFEGQWITARLEFTSDSSLAPNQPLEIRLGNAQANGPQTHFDRVRVSCDGLFTAGDQCVAQDQAGRLTEVTGFSAIALVPTEIGSFESPDLVFDRGRIAGWHTGVSGVFDPTTTQYTTLQATPGDQVAHPSTADWQSLDDGCWWSSTTDL